MVRRIYQIDLADKSEYFRRDEVRIEEREIGVVITAKFGSENNLGWLRKFFPWGEVRRVKEYEGEWPPKS